MEKITKKEYNNEFKEIIKYFNLELNKDNKYHLNTIWGDYYFFFDENCIFGRFENLKVDLLPEREQRAPNSMLYRIVHYPNIYSGKMNFHFYHVFDFINTLDRLVITN
jgi:hypothetical protein